MSSKKVRITKAELKSLNDAMSELKIHEQKLLQVVGAEQDLIKMKAYSELSQRLEKRYGQVIIDTVSGAISEANDNKGNT